MAKYVPVVPTDASLPLLVDLTSKIKAYVVTYFNVVSQRAIFGIYNSARKAFAACSQAKIRNPLAHAACYLVVGASYYFVDNGGEFHP